MSSKATFLLSVFLLLPACGKKGDPHPPERIRPARTTDLAVSQQGGSAMLVWTLPVRTTRGAALTDLAHLDVYRLVEPLASAAATPREYSEAEFRTRAEKMATLTAVQAKAATTTGQLVFEDRVGGLMARPVAVVYGVIAVRAGGETSELSNLASLAPQKVSLAPTTLAASPSAAGIRLTWNVPGGNLDGSSPASVAGYNIYRRAAGDPAYPSTPLNPQPVETSSFLDPAPTGERYAYAVKSVARLAPPRLESDPADEVEVNHADIYAPPAPENLSALGQPTAIRLVWDTVAAADLRGYVVYRQSGLGSWERLNRSLLPSPTFLDSTVTAGKTYRYVVAAHDDAGNESARSSPAEETVEGP